MFLRQPDFFHFMPDPKAFALTQCVFHLLQTDFDFHHLAAMRQRKAEDGVVLWRAVWPKRQGPVIVTQAAKPVASIIQVPP